MKKPVVIAVAICIAVTAYAFGQNNKKPNIKPCCCEHVQQIAEDLRWIRQHMAKPYKAPQDIKLNMPDFKAPEVSSPKYDIKNPGPAKVPAPPKQAPKTPLKYFER